MIVATVQGKPLTAIPQDLYVPPDALRVMLETFEGPLDLLLYLIKRQNVNILDIPLAEITRQYMIYIELMEELQLELAAEYLLMAAILAEIKSRLLLPKPSILEDEQEADPRAELIRHLEEYERYRDAAEQLNQLPRQQRDLFVASLAVADGQVDKPLAQVELPELVNAMCHLLIQTEYNASHLVQQEQLSTEERMSAILSTLARKNFVSFHHLFSAREGRQGIVVTLVAILELIKQSMIEITQAEPYSTIYVKHCN